MITILHGDNIVKSRQKLVELIDQAKDRGVVVNRLEAGKTDRPELESKLTKTSLFGTDRIVVLEELHSLRSTNKKKELIELILQAELDLILWESRSLTKTMLKKFPRAKSQEFGLTNQLFNWLDSLAPTKYTKPSQLQLLNEVIKTDDEYMCLAMLARQIRLLIQAKDGGQIKGPPFVISKIKKQARPFSLGQLLELHRQLVEFDLRLKTSTNQLEPGQFLEWFVYQL
ncbi:MAG: hypothetical protein GF381_03690 [Candidatus Pacebacteria bacterium]|nr:hypothetical protein [Candidatus Paceibacterota bacterium]